jgi:type I restriction enzyme S subunit
MAKTIEARVTPRLRFPGFRNSGAWETTTLGAIATILKGKGVAKSDVVPDGLLPCIRYGELYTRYGEVIDAVYSRTNVSVSELFLSRKHDVLIPASGETKLDIATAACVLLDGIALGSDLNVLRTRRNVNGVFLSYLLNSSKRKEIARVAQGDTIVHLYPSQLQNIVVPLTELSEQQKIADCLTSLNDVIAAQTRKVEALTAHRRGLMQQLFPREGETVPRLRFPEFAGEYSWHTAKMSGVLQKASKPVTVSPELSYREIGIRSHGKGIFHKEPVSGATIGDKRVFQVVGNALVLNIVFAWEQAVATTSHAEDGMIASHRFPMFVARPGKCDVRYVKDFFLTKRGKHLLGVASPGGAGRNKTLGQNEFENLEISLPESVEEQTHIADFLALLDGRMVAESKRLDALGSQKVGLMQQLFPSPDAG